MGLKLSKRVISYKTLRQFWENKPAYRDVIEPARAWFQLTEAADRKSPAEVKFDLSNASILKAGRIMFNLAKNKYRLVVWINFPYRVVYIRFIGTHKQYDAIDAQTI